MSILWLTALSSRRENAHRKQIHKRARFSGLTYWNLLDMTGKKQMTHARTAAALVVAALLASAVNAEAGAIANIELKQWGPHAASGPNVTLRNFSGAPIATDALTYGGAFLWNVLPGSSLTPAPTIDDFVDPTPGNTVAANATDLLTFCLELNRNIGWGGQYRAEILPLADLPSSGAPPGSSPLGMGPVSAELIAKLWYKYYSNAVAGLSPQGATISPAAGAFQLAIWKLEYDPELMTGTSFAASGFGSGFLTVDDLSHSIVSLAASWIDDILKNRNVYEMANLRGLRLTDRNGNGDYQDQVAQLTGGNIQSFPAPEPASLAIWLVVGAAFAVPKLRRRRTESAASAA